MADHSTNGAAPTRRRIDEPVPELGDRRPGAMGSGRLRGRPGRLPRGRELPGLPRHPLPHRNPRLLRVHRVGRRAAVEQRQGRASTFSGPPTCPRSRSRCCPPRTGPTTCTPAAGSKVTSACPASRSGSKGTACSTGSSSTPTTASASRSGSSATSSKARKPAGRAGRQSLSGSDGWTGPSPNAPPRAGLSRRPAGPSCTSTSSSGSWRRSRPRASSRARSRRWATGSRFGPTP
jgi:hypothetical protein